MSFVFNTYCVVCEKQCRDSADMYCSRACHLKDVAGTPKFVPVEAPKTQTTPPLPTYPSVLDYYMEESEDVSSDDERDFSPTSPTSSYPHSSERPIPTSSVSRQSMLNYRLSLQIK